MRLNLADPVLVVGAGAMGAGIAQVAAAAGHPVGLYDVQGDAPARALAVMGAALGKLVERGKMEAAEREALLARITPVASLADFAQARLVVEAVKEDLAVKQTLFAELEGLVAADAILATNTSSISITAIASALKRPERFAGLHFFNPAPLMALVEVVQGLATDPAVVAALVETAAAWGKNPVVARSTPGFIVNRVARPYYAESLRVLQEGGGDVATLDAVLREGAGFRMGPFELMDLIGHDVNFAVTRSVHDAYFGDPRFTPSIIQQELVEAGRLGRKSGRGFYDYADGAVKVLAAQAEAGPAPSRVEAQGDAGPLRGLVQTLRDAGLTVGESQGSDARLLVDGVTIAATDGRSATERAVVEGLTDLVLIDTPPDWSAAKRFVIAVADQVSGGAAAKAAGALQTTGKPVSRIADVPGLLITRTLAMLANEAADAVLQGVATAEAVDTAMRKGVNYPVGPLAWADACGPARVVAILDNLARTYGEDRYRASALLRRLAASGGRFHGARA